MTMALIRQNPTMSTSHIQTNFEAYQIQLSVQLAQGSDYYKAKANTAKSKQKFKGRGNRPKIPQMYSSYNSATYSPYYNPLIDKNSYIDSKRQDDARFDRAVLKRPAFLLKEVSIYPYQNEQSHSISSSMDYADNLIRPRSKHFYTQQAENERISAQGINPFMQQSAVFAESFSHSSRLKKSSRSRLNNKSNLGVDSYRPLNNFPNTNPNIQEEDEYQFQRNNTGEFVPVPSRSKPMDIDRYIESMKYIGSQQQISQSRGNNQPSHRNEQQNQSDSDDMFHSGHRQSDIKRQSNFISNQESSYRHKKVSQAKPRQIPRELYLRGKNYKRII